VKELVADGYAIVDACRFIGLPRSSYYYAAKAKDEVVERAVIEVAEDHVTYGTRRVTHQLRRGDNPVHINRKQVQRIMREHDLLRPVKRRKKRTTQSNHGYGRYPNLIKDMDAAYPNHIWVADITYIRFGSGFIYLAVILDVFTRMIRGWHVHRSLDQMLSLNALYHALHDGHPKIHHSDQGVQYAATAYTAQLKQVGTRISMAERGCPEENGYAERIMRTIKEEEIDLSEYESFQDAREQIDYYIGVVYNQQRIHSALGYQTPAEFEAAYYRDHPAPLPEP
jgi:putative transposase